jgi:hypothetical protein
MAKVLDLRWRKNMDLTMEGCYLNIEAKVSMGANSCSAALWTQYKSVRTFSSESLQN